MPEIVRRADAKLLQEGTVAQAGYKSRRVHLLQPQECLDIQVVVMIVAD